MNKKRFWFLAIPLLASFAFGGGTVFDEEVNSILDQQPNIASFVRTHFEFCKASWFTDLRIGSMYPLGGQRLGPYERRCRFKESTGDFDFIITVNTSYKGYDKKGKEVTSIEQASRIDESFTSIDIRYEACKDDWCKAPQQGAQPDAGTGCKLTP